MNQYSARLTIVDDRTGCPVDTRIVHAPDHVFVERRCAAILPLVAAATGVDVALLRGEIARIAERRSDGTPAMGAALLT